MFFNLIFKLDLQVFLNDNYYYIDFYFICMQRV